MLKPCLARATTCIPYCSAPPTVTPSPTARIGTEKFGARKMADAIMPRLKNAGARAGIKKERSEFNVPMASAARLIKRRKGNIILINLTVSENFTGFPVKLGAIADAM